MNFAVDYDKMLQQQTIKTLDMVVELVNDYERKTIEGTIHNLSLAENIRILARQHRAMARMRLNAEDDK